MTLKEKLDTVYTQLQTGKELLADALTYCGITASKDETYDSLIQKMDQLNTKQGNLSIMSDTDGSFDINGVKYTTKIVNNGWNMNVSDKDIISLSFENAPFYNIDLSDVTMYKVDNMSFKNCANLESLVFGYYNFYGLVQTKNVFQGCDKLKYITCTELMQQYLKDHQDEWALPTAMRDGGGGVWTLI